eukprot:3209783-Karenia_brevis.AAC.1
MLGAHMLNVTIMLQQKEDVTTMVRELCQSSPKEGGPVHKDVNTGVKIRSDTSESECKGVGSLKRPCLQDIDNRSG